MSRHDVDSWVGRLIRPDVLATAAYHVADARGMVKLDAMENPFAWPEQIREELCRRILDAQINRYPDPQASALRECIRTTFGIDARWDILLGNGSDEIIQILIAALAGTAGCVLAPAPTFVMFRVIAQWMKVPYVEVPLAPSLQLDMPAMLDAIARERPGLIFLACPNNPTGNLFAEADVRTILGASRALVVIDEAYLSFASREHLGLLEEFPNLVIMRTLSKLGLAGLRLGYLVGDPRWIAEFDKLRLPYNIGTLNQLAAEVALESFALLREQTEQIKVERERVRRVLDADARVHCWDERDQFPAGAPAPGVAGGGAGGAQERVACW
jgi:histidinol-phosphate aminotransferase